MAENPSLDKDYRLWLLLAQTKSTLFKAREKKIGQYIHPNQAIALVSIAIQNGTATPSFLSQVLALEIHSVTGLINRMVEKGLVVKSRDPEKKNVIRLSVTPKGQEMAEKVRQIEFVREMISRLTPEQQEQLRTCLTILLDAGLAEMGTEALIHF
jgi:MarR family transcriptional regulator, transcriptional regulator for hemolysin